MTDHIERGARTLYRALDRQHGPISPEKAEQIFRDALKAIRHPEEAMVEAGVRASDRVDFGPADAARIFTAMVDALLNG